MRTAFRLLLVGPILLSVSPMFSAPVPVVPDWALPGSATHQQVPPPKDFHRPTRTLAAPIGLFEGRSDVGGAVVPGSASYEAAAGRYTINSAGYNIWYTRDEFHYLWRRMSGDFSLAADIAFPIPGGYGDRKVVLIVRQDLDDDSKEAMAALHGAGLIHLAVRREKNTDIQEAGRLQGGGPSSRIGLRKQGDTFMLLVSLKGEPLHAVGDPITVHFDAPFYVGIGFCSHLPATADTAVVSNVVLETPAGTPR